MEKFWLYKDRIADVLAETIKNIVNLYATEEKYNSSEEDFVEHFRNDVFFVFITRKGYWIYKSLFNSSKILEPYSKYFCIGGLDGIQKRNYCTDRYLMKQVSADFLRDRKKIYVVDDTVTNGYNMEEYYRTIKRLVSSSGYKAVNNSILSEKTKVIPMVLAASSEFINKVYAIKKELAETDVINSDNIADDGIEEKKAFFDFAKEMAFRYEMTQDDIARLCIEETKIFQGNLNSLVMDLPIYNSIVDGIFDYENSLLDVANSTIGSKAKTVVTLSKEEFDMLIASDEKWEYIKNSYSILKDSICCDYLILNDRVLSQRLSGFFFDFVVKCKYNYTDDGMVNVVFTPFALVKSCRFLDLWNVFGVLFEGSRYYKQILDFISKRKDASVSAKDYFCYKAFENTISDSADEILITNMYRSIFRAVISSLSIFVMRVFNEKVRKIIGKELNFDALHFLESNSEEYCYAVFESVYGSAQLPISIESYLKRIAAINIEAKAAVNVGEHKEYTDITYTERKKATEQIVEYKIREFVIKHKRTDRKREERAFISMENIEKGLDDFLEFDSKNQKKRYLTKAIVKLLELSCISNYVHIDKNNYAIIRSFCHGENSEVLMTPGVKWLYPYFFELFFSKGTDYYRTHIDSFIEWLIGNFEINDYINNLISIDEFNFVTDYFKRISTNADQLYRQILSKKYYLEFYDEKEGRINPWEFFMEKAFKMTDNWSAENP